VFVFRDNQKGCGFYRSLGARHFDSGDFEVAGKRYPDQSFVWGSLRELHARLHSAETDTQSIYEIK
jgi:hypothetical protein